MEQQVKSINITEGFGQKPLARLLVYLNQNRASIIQKWAMRLRKLNSADNAMSRSNIIESTSSAFDVFYNILSTNDFYTINSYSKILVKTSKCRGSFITEILQSFSNLRDILIRILVKIYDSNELPTILNLINRSIDRMIFYACYRCQKDYDQELKEHAHNLEMEVQKRTRELEESHRNYQILVEEISDGCFVSKRGKIVFANKAFCEMHGYALEELIGKECQQLIAEDSRSTVMERFTKQLKGEIPYHQYIYCRQDKQGQRLPTENKLKLIKYNGDPAVLGLCSDITARLEMEKKIRQQDRLAVIGELATSIAHEIRNPLSAIKVNVELLLQKLDLEGNDLRRLQIANEQLARLESVISQMLEYAKPLKLNFTLTNINEIIDDSIKLLDQRIKENNVSLVKKFDQTLPNIMVDKDKVLQTLDNILRNALEALGENGEHKSIELESKREIFHSKEYVKFSIADNGIGINPEDKKNIFHPFFTNGKKDGVGLGLSIVKKIIDTHHGIIRVESEKGEGTSFSIYVPIDIYS
jgi:PAS domain S-box-containing protein